MKAIFLSLFLISSVCCAEELAHSSTVVKGEVRSDITNIQNSGVKYIFPSVNRNVFIFEGIHKEISVDQVPKIVVKTDNYGKFVTRLQPGVYTITILVNSKYISNTRPDGYYEFIDCCYNKECNIQLLDKSKVQP